MADRTGSKAHGCAAPTQRAVKICAVQPSNLILTGSCRTIAETLAGGNMTLSLRACSYAWQVYLPALAG